MKFELSSAAGRNLFTGYGEGYVRVNGRRLDSNSIVLAERILAWEVEGFETLTLEHFSAIAALQPEIVLLGTGDRLRFPRPEFAQRLAGARIGLEVMDTGAACRTFNILVAEGREVAAALLFDRPSRDKA